MHMYIINNKVERLKKFIDNIFCLKQVVRSLECLTYKLFNVIFMYDN